MDFEKVPSSVEELEKIIQPESEIVTMADAVVQLKAQRGERDYFPVGYELFDEAMAGGVAFGDFVVIGGRPGEGKTTLAQNFSFHLAKLMLPQLWFSYEMDLQEIWDKFKVMGINEDFLSYVPLQLVSGQIDWVEKRILEGVLKHSVRVIIIDHLGFLAPKATGTSAERNYAVYLTQIAAQLKELARQYGVIIFLLAHTRKTKDELELEDFAFTSGLQQYADFAFMIERERERRKMVLGQDTGDRFTPFSKISLAKNRRTGRGKFIRVMLNNGHFRQVLNTPQDAPNIYDF